MSLNQCLRVSLIFFISLASGPVFSHNDESRQFDKEKLEEYKKDPAFDYHQDYQKPESLLGIILAYIIGIFASLFDNPELSWLGPLLLRLFIAAGIIMAVISILKLRFGHVFIRSGKSLQSPAVVFSGSEQEDYNRLLQESISSKSYKLAVRYLFLTALTTLDQQKFIRITRWKTPNEYLNELPVEKRGPFKILVDLFENTWYGDYTAGEESIEQGLQMYKQLQNG